MFTSSGFLILNIFWKNVQITIRGIDLIFLFEKKMLIIKMEF